MPDTTDISHAASDEPRTSGDKRPASDGRVRRRAIIAALLALLLLFGCALLWPVPGSESGADDGEDARTGPGQESIRIISLEAAVLSDVPIRSGKGFALRVVAELENQGDERAYDQNWLALQTEGFQLVPLPLTHEGVSRHVVAPTTIDARSRASVAAVFAIPNESTDATLVVLPGDVRPDEASSYAFLITGGGQQ